ncbi:hypothetical protein PVAP13_6NG288625 [Panicum virgatum]|uniref:Uncharacterized protein n=1 Tax=Panicum virgatum TaxID=38727 RepID=A0A8T0R2Y8_PANVG|nr:hypothetical protein PVAP13_6NG288625 [Panicum virgatum]
MTCPCDHHQRQRATRPGGHPFPASPLRALGPDDRALPRPGSTGHRDATATRHRGRPRRWRGRPRHSGASPGTTRPRPPLGQARGSHRPPPLAPARVHVSRTAATTTTSPPAAADGPTPTQKTRTAHHPYPAPPRLILLRRRRRRRLHLLRPTTPQPPPAPDLDLGSP